VTEAAGPGDERLLGELRGLLQRSDQVPEHVVEAAKASYSWRTIDAELAELTHDSLVDAQAVTVRGQTGPRALTFEASDVSIEVEVAASGSGRRLLGQVLPPQRARIDVRQHDSEIRTVDSDDLGRFAIDNLGQRPLSLRCHLSGRRPVLTDWVHV
jgi:hypothetical protein